MFTIIPSILVLITGASLAAAKPESVFILADSGEVCKVSLTTGEILAQRDFEAYFSKGIFADPQNASWACLEGSREGGGALIFFDPNTLEPLGDWYPSGGPELTREEERLQGVTFDGEVLVHPDGSKLYYYPVSAWSEKLGTSWRQLFVLSPKSRQSIKSLGAYYMLFEKSFRCDQQWFSLVTAGEREEYRRRLINLETDEVGEFFQWGTDYEQPWEIGTVSNGKGFLAVARQKADGVVDLLRISVQTDGSVAHTKEIADVSRLLSLENMRGFDEGRLSFSSDGRYLISRLKPGVIDILDIAAKEVKRVPLDSFIARGGWEFPVLKGPYLFLGWDKMIYPLLEHYDFKGTLSRPPWPKARGKRADLLIIDIATAKVERVIPVYGCGGFRNLAIMGSTK